MRDLTTVRAELEAKRKKMIEAGMRFSLAHPETIRLSQEVDELHNEYVCIERSKMLSEQREISKTQLLRRHWL